MKKHTHILLVIALSLWSCKEQYKETNSTVYQVEIKKKHWWELPLYVDNTGNEELIEMRTKENQEKIKKLWDAFDRLEKSDYTKAYLTLEEIRITNDLNYIALKLSGFQFPNEEVFAQRIKEIFKVDIYADHTNNPRIIQKDDFLILCSKIYPLKYNKIVPTIAFASTGFIFDLKRRFLTEIGMINGYIEEKTDDYGENYSIYTDRKFPLTDNNYLFYTNNATLNSAYYSYLPKRLILGIGYEDFPSAYNDIYKKIQRDIYEKYKKRSSRSREGWDYRMYDRLFFSRGFDGKLIVKKKMLAAAVELAKEDEAYIRVPLDYYFIQMTTPYVANEYAADYSEVDNYFTQREPFYTPEERAMIWVYTSLLELHLPPSEKLPAPYMFIGLTLNYPELAKVAEEHNYFGEDMEEVLNIIDRTNGWW